MLHHHEPTDAVITNLDSDIQLGLSTQQVMERRAQYGDNKLEEKKKKSN